MIILVKHSCEISASSLKETIKWRHLQDIINTHTARACLGFWRMKQMIEMGVYCFTFPSPSPMDAHSLQPLTPLQYITSTHLCTWQRETRNNVTEADIPCLIKETTVWQDKAPAVRKLGCMTGAIHYMNASKMLLNYQVNSAMHPLNNRGQVSNFWSCNPRFWCILS